MVFNHNYTIERDRYVVWFWKLSFSFKVDKFNSHDRILVLRTNHTERHMEIIIMKTHIIYIGHKHRQTINHSMDFNNKKINVSIYSDPNGGILKINNNEFILDKLICSGRLTEINSTIPIDCPKIDYLNFNSTIPRVYGDCFTNLHTHKMFGKYLIEQGSNYYCVNIPSVYDSQVIFKCIEDDIQICEPSKVYILLKSNLHHVLPLYNDISTKYPHINFVCCTMPHKLNKNNKYNKEIRNGSMHFIDFDKAFKNLNKDDYFIDNAHTNEEGAKVLLEVLRKEAPDLFIKYKI